MSIPSFMSYGVRALFTKWVLLLTLIVGISTAHPDARYPPQKIVEKDAKVARSPFAKFKDLVAGGVDVTLTDNAPAATTTPLECFQVAEPVLTPQGALFHDGLEISGNGISISIGGKVANTVALMEHSFANSYDAPFVGTIELSSLA